MVLATCQRILRREFSRDFFLSVTNANRLDSRFLCKALEEFDVPADHEHSRMKLKCDFLALTYLLKNLCDSRGRLPKEQRLLAHAAAAANSGGAVRRNRRPPGRAG